MPEELVIQVNDLWHVYPNGVEALRGVSLDIKKGEYVAIIGQNGSGKTTLAKHFNGLLKPTKGQVIAGHCNITEVKVSEISHTVGYVFQNPDDMLFCSSVEEEIGFGPRLLGYAEEDIKQRVETTMKTLELLHLRDQHPFSLSLGDRQRVAVACALSLDPQVFVFDEPTTGQDFIGGQSIMAIIDQLHASGRTIIIITHDMRLVAEHVKRVIVMNQGQMMCDSSPTEVFAKMDMLEKLSLRAPQVAQLAQRLDWKGKAILDVAEMCDWLIENNKQKKLTVQGE